MRTPRIKMSVNVEKDLHTKLRRRAIDRGCTVQYLVGDALDKHLNPESHPEEGKLDGHEQNLLIARFSKLVRLNNRDMNLFLQSFVQAGEAVAPPPTMIVQ